MSALPALGWGFLGAVSWGLSALCWSPAIRCGIGVWPMLHWVFVFSLITAAGGAILIEGAPVISSTAAVGAVGAGMLYAIGDALFFRAVAAWLVSLVAPIVACSGAVNAVLAVMSGDTVGAATAGGLTLMVVGVVAVAAGDFPEGDASSHRSRPLWPIGLAAGAAVAFGLVFFVSGKTAGGEAPWLVAIARAGALPFIAALCVASRQGFMVPSGAWRWVIGAGITDAIGYAAFIEGSGYNLPVAGVAISQYAAVTAVGGVVLLGERFTRHQAVGVALMLAGAAFVAAQAS